MSVLEAQPPSSAPAPFPPRELGRIVGSHPGPTLVVVGAIHGNEPCGPAALERVLADLAGREHLVAGELVALVGNRQALSRGVRYVDRDLNRAWTRERLQLLRSRHSLDSARAEDVEQLELDEALEAAFARSQGPTFVLDLHSTSGEGAPFVVLSDNLQNRAWAVSLQAPVVLGIEEELEGTLLSYLSDRGHITLGFEGGQHDAKRTIDHAETAVWIALEAIGLLERGAVARPQRLGRLLEQAVRGLPRAVEVRYRHAITAADGFVMRPHYKSFQAVAEGEILADDRVGPVLCPADGLILMPLYQKQGNDGFFLVRGFSPLWLRVSGLLRQLGADGVVHWLPGVRRHPEREATYIVNRRIARFYVMEIFHLLGFRRVSENPREFVVARRPDDLERDHTHRRLPRRPKH